MNFLSLNVRGIGQEAKARRVSNLMFVHKIYFLCIKETQFTDGSKIRARSSWRSDSFEWDFVNFNGRSGGLLCAWDMEVFMVVSTIKSKFYMVVKGKIKGYDQIVFIVNVYGPRNLPDRKMVWLELQQLKENNPGVWVLIGDFNAVRFMEDKCNSDFDPACATALNGFLTKAYLHQFTMKGQRYTYCKDKDRKLSKIDRYLSDHSPLVLISHPFDYGPCPFRVFNSWLEVPNLEAVVVGALSSMQFVGSPDVILSSKLKCIKEEIKKWVNIRKSKATEKYDKACSDLHDLDLAMEERDLEEEEE
ncbi:uncharacterized protein LOC110870689 [Helianthus annuus]|uniref:uncharacterized protein LOC110870689 n=1 Tax=Helianthus annuus TaxID=4232 RepID=UPI000B908552|nr:uncharacterized protein LOC110870689 [Helianthus annuus]